MAYEESEIVSMIRVIRAVLICGALLVVAFGLAAADEEALILKVEKPVSSAALSKLGFLHLADLNDAYLVQGDEQARNRLAAAGIGFVEIGPIYPGEDVFLLRPRGPSNEPLYTAALDHLGKGEYLAKIGCHEIDDLRLIPFSKVRLLPGRFPELSKPRIKGPFRLITPNPQIIGMVAQVTGDTLWKYISQLSGGEPVVINGQQDTLLTRYSLSWRIDHAADYLRERFEDYGLDARFHHYTIGQYGLYAVSFADSLNGWVVGNQERIYRTRDGGISWVRQYANASGHSFWGVSFVDTLTGWIAGSAGKIFRTGDGGETWTEQNTPVGVTLREISMLDSLNGWVVGYAATTLRTTNGGDTWVKVPAPTGSDLYGCDFESMNSGWACGRDGTILYYNGAGWAPQASGTANYLLDVDFSTHDNGLAVGWGRTILRTMNGGSTWNPLPVPPEVNPFLQGVDFIDGTCSGWVVGLNGTILNTDDCGATWRSQDSRTLFGLRWVRFSDELEGWAVGYGSTILHTADGGSAWESQLGNLPPEDLISLKNVVATKPGTSSDEEVIICGHFDSISEDPENLAPGADDNATGTAAVIEAARVLAEYPFERTVKLICFSGEEQGLFGSGEYAGDAGAAGDRIIGVLNFDMIGYADVRPEDIDIVADSASEWLANFALDCAHAYVRSLATLKIIDETSVLSDHASFWKAGYHAILGTEDEDLSYPYYHTTGDTLGNLTKTFTAKVVKMAVATVAELARPDTTLSILGPGEEVSVIAAYPNPFTARTTISFVLSSRAGVKVTVFNVEGRVVDRLLEEALPAGRCEVKWDGTGREGAPVSPGIYFIKVQTGRRTAAAKIVVLR
jgi:photosystem II stability/assembly factor-like uncharacterized protein